MVITKNDLTVSTTEMREQILANIRILYGGPKFDDLENAEVVFLIAGDDATTVAQTAVVHKNSRRILIQGPMAHDLGSAYHSLLILTAELMGSSLRNHEFKTLDPVHGDDGAVWERTSGAVDEDDQKYGFV